MTPPASLITHNTVSGIVHARDDLSHADGHYGVRRNGASPPPVAPSPRHSPATNSPVHKTVPGPRGARPTHREPPQRRPPGHDNHTATDNHRATDEHRAAAGGHSR